MKRHRTFRDEILSSAASSSKRKKIQMLLEELTRPEIDVPALSQHTTLVFSQMQQQNLMMIPQLIRQIQKQNEPIVLEITKNKIDENESILASEGDPSENQSHVALSGFEATATSSDIVEIDDITGEVPSMYVPPSSEGFVDNEGIDLDQTEGAGQKQFEIIFSDSARPSDGDSENHIIHSTTECTAATQEAAGTVNVPNSFPLFQIVHTGEVPEDLQHEIVRLIRQANPELDLNSITFKFKSPETVEIIANVNS